MNLNLFLWRHLKISSLRLFNSWLVNLYLMMLICFSKQSLHLLLKLPGVEYVWINIHLICLDRPLFYKLQNNLDKTVSKQRIGKRVSIIVEHLFPLQKCDSNRLVLFYIIFYGKNACFIDHFLRIRHFSRRDNLLYFFNYNVIYFSAEYLLPFCLWSSCFDYRIFSIYYLNKSN